ncbi:MAG: hypothetical protein ACJ72W_08075 [Actinoallomurus sp.]
MSNPIGHLTTATSYIGGSGSGGNAYTIQAVGFNVFGESLGTTITLPPSEGALAGNYTFTHNYKSTTGLPYHDIYPASPGGGSLPSESVVHGFVTLEGLDLPTGLGGLNTYANSTTYDAFDQVTQTQLGVGTASGYISNTFDPYTGDLTDTNIVNTAVSATPIDDTSYTYDPAGNPTSQTETRQGGATETQCFRYDTLDRLTQAWTATDKCAADPSTNGGALVGDGIAGGAYWTSWAFDWAPTASVDTAPSGTTVYEERDRSGFCTPEVQPGVQGRGRRVGRPLGPADSRGRPGPWY